MPSAAAGKGRGRFGLYMRQHVAPLDLDAHPDHPAWSAEKVGSLAVWGSGGLVANLCAVVQRRLLEQSRLRLPDKPFDAAFGVASGEIADFLDASEDFDRRVAALLVGLAWVRPARWGGDHGVAPLPFAYAVLKPLFATRAALARLDRKLPDLPIPESLPALLMGGQVPEAVRIGQERARASGLPTPFLSLRRSDAIHRSPDVRFGQRLPAALVIPVTTTRLDQHGGKPLKQRCRRRCWRRSKSKLRRLKPRAGVSRQPVALCFTRHRRLDRGLRARHDGLQPNEMTASQRSRGCCLPVAHDRGWRMP
jgi:CRISPR-associated protein Csx17